MKKLFVCLFVIFSILYSYASVFRLNSQSARQQGMGNVGTGISTGPSNIFFNPGALSLLEQGGISISGSAIYPDISYNMPGTLITAEVEDNIIPSYGIYAHFKLYDKLSLGIGAYTPYGSNVEWPANWTGRAISQKTNQLYTFIQPTVSYKINDKIGIGAGFIYAIGTIKMERGIPKLINDKNQEADIILENDELASGIGFHVGIFFTPFDKLSIGLDYRSKVKMNVDNGKVELLNIPELVKPSYTATEFDSDIPLPAELTFGISFKPSKKFLFTSDISYIFWSQFDQLTFDYNGLINSQKSSTTVYDWSDRFSIKFGGQYTLANKLDLRAGAYWDFSPVPDETLSPVFPDTDRFGITAGAGYSFTENLSLDLSLSLLKSEQRTVQASKHVAEFGQRYKISMFVPSISITYNF